MLSLLEIIACVIVFPREALGINNKGKFKGRRKNEARVVCCDENAEAIGILKMVKI